LVSARAHFEHHGRELARRVVILLHRVGDALARGKVYRPLAGHGKRGGAALRGVLAFRLDRDLRLAPDVELALRVRLLVNLAALRRGRDRIKHAALGNAGFNVLRDELVAVAGDANAGILRPARGTSARKACLFTSHRWLTHKIIKTQTAYQQGFDQILLAASKI